ncbi:MAG TPA: hypothetical protein VFS97_12770 [Nitrososphaeraceae archaeon]|nr:hypothetical protein [Nitrososphaeraceae archaeon]
MQPLILLRVPVGWNSSLMPRLNMSATLFHLQTKGYDEKLFHRIDKGFVLETITQNLMGVEEIDGVLVALAT